jgi:hypothetical protein
MKYNLDVEEDFEPESEDPFDGIIIHRNSVQITAKTIDLGNGCKVVKWTDGLEVYSLGNIRHREDGPAIIRNNGTKSYYLFDVEYSEEDYNQMILLKPFWDK